jgi:hypothetical protein
MKKMLCLIVMASGIFAVSTGLAQRVCTMQFAVMIHPQTGECRNASNGCVISDLRKQGYRIAKSGECSADLAAFEADDSTVAALKAQMHKVDAQVRAEIADLSCRRDSHCQTIAYGNRPCGGPATYLIYSAKNVDAVKLTALAARYTQLHSRYNQAVGAISICSMEMPPKTACQNNVCGESSDF